MNFPFRATCIRKMSSSLLRKGEEVEVLSMTDEDDLLPRYVQVKWQDREFAVPLAQLEGIDVNDETHQAITDWHYWVGRGYLF